MAKKKKRPIVQKRKPSVTMIPYADRPIYVNSSDISSPSFYSRLANLEQLLAEQQASRETSLKSASSASSATSSPHTRPEPAPSSPQVDSYTARLSIESARARYDDLWYSGFTDSPAFSRLNDEQFPGDKDLENMSQSELNKWYMISESFLADKTSTIDGYTEWKWQNDVSFYHGAFGGHWGDKNYDESRVDKDLSKEVFLAYRLLEEEKAALIMEYGSQNLIEELYTAATQGKDYLQYGLDQLNQLEKGKAEYWANAVRENPAPAMSGIRGDWTEEDISDMNW